MEFSKLKKNQKGFTLIEMLVAMSIFVGFIGILLNSYTTIVRSQRQANEYREMYVEARQIFDYVIGELREGMVDYRPATLSGRHEDLQLVAKDASYFVNFDYEAEDGSLTVDKRGFDGAELDAFQLNDQVQIVDMAFYVSPGVDPYAAENFADNAAQFQPKVTVWAMFEKDGYQMELQTTISSRIYNQIQR